MAARLSGVANIVAVDLNHDRLAFALRLGATHVSDPRVLDMPAMAVAAGCAASFDYIVDTTGNLDVVNKALPALGPRGELALVGAYPPASVEADASFMMSGGRVIRGIVEGGADPKQFIPQLLAHYRAGRFPFDQLIRKFAWGNLQTAIESGEQGTVLKPVVVMP
jgi:aryl-alcohol dehydrogenase